MEITGFDTFESVVLEDKLWGTEQNLVTNPNYKATVIVGDMTSRFYLHLVTDNASASESAELRITASTKHFYCMAWSKISDFERVCLRCAW